VGPVFALAIDGRRKFLCVVSPSSIEPRESREAIPFSEIRPQLPFLLTLRSLTSLTTDNGDRCSVCAFCSSSPGMLPEDASAFRTLRLAGVIHDPKLKSRHLTEGMSTYSNEPYSYIRIVEYKCRGMLHWTRTLQDLEHDSTNDICATVR
jgi:hypothetical protein